MKHTIKLFLALLLLLSGEAINGQGNQIEGLWMIENVRMGDRDMTPIAKWTRIKPDGSYESGNGWLKNSEGFWKYDKTASTFLAKETNGLTDPNGAFKVSLQGGKMTWERTEEGQKVRVTLSRINKVPKSPADKIQGLWDLEQVKEKNEDITQNNDPNNKHYIFIRWDRFYVERNEEGKQETGYWHMNAHKPEITFISHNEEQKSTSWAVEYFSDKKISMTGLSDSNKGQLLIYRRLDSFPE